MILHVTRYDEASFLALRLGMLTQAMEVYLRMGNAKEALDVYVRCLDSGGVNEKRRAEALERAAPEAAAKVPMRLAYLWMDDHDNSQLNSEVLTSALLQIVRSKTCQEVAKVFECSCFCLMAISLRFGLFLPPLSVFVEEH